MHFYLEDKWDLESRFVEDDQFRFGTVKGDLVRKEPFVKEFEVNVKMFLKFLWGAACLEQVCIISKVIDLAMADSPMEIIDVNKEKKRAQDRTLRNPMLDRPSRRLESKDRNILGSIGEVRGKPI